jgi:REP element-mobilizing transposase RayT
MSHTYVAIYFHCVFSTKERRNIIPAELQSKLWAYIAGTAANLDIVPVSIGGTSNHAHLLIGLKPTMTLCEAVQKLKANSSRWMGEHGLNFEWQKGYAAFSVSPSLLEGVKAYVLNQQEHHRRRSFEVEFLVLLRKSNIAYDAEDVFVA